MSAGDERDSVLDWGFGANHPVFLKCSVFVGKGAKKVVPSPNSQVPGHIFNIKVHRLENEWDLSRGESQLEPEALLGCSERSHILGHEIEFHHETT